MEVDRGENTAERLVELGTYLSTSGRYRFAALAFSTAASGASGAHPSLRADALYLSAENLHTHNVKNAHHASSEEDLLRAQALIQKGLLLAKSLPDAFGYTMKFLGLLEKVHVQQNDTQSAEKVSKLALVEMRKAAQRGDHIWDWWVYFRTRQLKSTRSAIDQDHLLQLASTAATLAEKRKDTVSAAGFYLCLAQIYLTSTSKGYQDSLATSCVSKASHHLSTIPLEQLPAAAPLRIARILLAGFTMLRVGNIAMCRHELSKEAQDALAALERPSTYRSGNSNSSAGTCSWVWLPVPVMSALLQHLLACAYRTVDDGSIALVSAERALGACGIRDGDGQWGRQGINASSGVSKAAERALAICLLESSARVKMATVNLPGAYPLINAALKRAREKRNDDVDVSKAAALLLAAEYYSLSGNLDHARNAIAFLDIIEKAGNGNRNDAGHCNGATNGHNYNNNNRAFGDILAMAHTHRSLLTGNGRVGDDSEEAFIAKQVRAAALFADGVFHMRGSRLIDAKAALQGVLSLVGDGAAVNEQIIASALIVHAGLFMLYENIPDGALAPAGDAIKIAERAGDLVNTVRAKRQRYKLLAKAHPGKSAVAHALASTKQAVGILTKAQSHFVPLDSETATQS